MGIINSGEGTIMKIDVSINVLDKLDQSIKAYSALTELISGHDGEANLSDYSSGIFYLMKYIEDDLQKVSDAISGKA